MSQWYPSISYGSNTGAATTWSNATYTVSYPQATQITIQPAPPGRAKTEVEGLLDEVEAVCALAR